MVYIKLLWQTLRRKCIKYIACPQIQERETMSHALVALLRIFQIRHIKVVQ